MDRGIIESIRRSLLVADVLAWIFEAKTCLHVNAIFGETEEEAFPTTVYVNYKGLEVSEPCIHRTTPDDLGEAVVFREPIPEKVSSEAKRLHEAVMEAVHPTPEDEQVAAPSM